MRCLIIIIALCAINSNKLFANANNLQKFNIYLKCEDKKNDKKKDTISITYNLYYPFRDFIRKRVIINAGEEKKVIPLTVQTVDLFFNGAKLFVEPNDTIVFSINSLNEVILDGPDKKFYMYEDYSKKMFYSHFKSPLKLFASLSVDANEYKNYCLKYMENEKSFIDSFFGDEKPVIKNYLTQKSSFDFVWFFSNLFEKDKFAYEDSILLSSHAVQLVLNTPDYFDYSYRNALFKYVELIAGESQSIISSSKLGHIFISGEKLLSQEAYKYLLLKLMDIISLVSSSEYEYLVKNLYDKLKKMNFTQEEIVKIREMYSKTIIASKKLSDFNEIDVVTTKGIQKKIKDVLLPKKLYLIDFWASWCVPCIAEFPFIQKLIMDYPEIQVISISIDEDKAKWLTSIKKHGLSPKNSFLIATQKKNKFLENYQIKEIPRFLLYNSKGECITSNASRPSEKQFTAYLNQLLSAK